jgi:hypothetical protein
MPSFAGEGTYVSAAGSSVVFLPDATNVAILTINNIGWAAKYESKLFEVTNGQSLNHTRWLATQGDSSGSFEVVFNAGSTPESVGLVQGAYGFLTAYEGNSGRGKLQYVVIKSLEYKCECQGGKAVMYTINWQGNAPASTF